MKLLFLHGLQSTPGGVKLIYLKSHEHTVLNPHLPDDFDAAVRLAQAEPNTTGFKTPAPTTTCILAFSNHS
ncbi:MAG: hypothetical protein ACYC0X_30980 [Pirellulaceae bacterium]